MPPAVSPDGHRDGHVPEDGRGGGEAQHHHHAPERRPDEDQEADRPDRVEGDPLRGEAQAQQDADERHAHPEGSPPLPGARPDRREQGDRRDDEERRVRVVHRDPLLDEEHPVEQAEDPREDRHRAAAEQDSRQQEQQPGHERARDHARKSPGERVLADVDRGGLAIAAEHEQLLAVRGRLVDVDVRRPRGGLERQARVGEDAVPPRLHRVDGPARAVRRASERMHDLARIVDGDPADRGRHPDGLVDGRRGAVGGEPDRGERLPRRRVDHRRVESVNLDQAGRAAGKGDVAGHGAALRVHERHAARVGHRHARDARDAQPRQRTAGDGGVELGPLVLDRGRDGHPRRARAELLLVRGGRPAEDPGELRRRAGRVGHRRRIRHERVDRARVDDLRPAGQAERGETGAARDVERDERVAGRRRDEGGPGIGEPEAVHRATRRSERVEGDRGRRARVARPKVAGADGRVEGQDVARRGADVEAVAGGVERDGPGARQHERRQALAGLQVEHPQVRARRHVEPVAALASAPDGRRVDPAGFGRDVGDRHAERARGRHPVVAERDEPAGDRVLGEMRVGVLVDRVRLPVAPVLQELGGRPGVVDLVEVHPRGLAQAERPQAERHDDEHDDEPQVETVEPAAALAIEQVRAVEARAARERTCSPGRPAEARREREPAGSRKGVELRDHPCVLVGLGHPGGGRVGLGRRRAGQEREARHQPAGVEHRARRHSAPRANRISELGPEPSEREQHRGEPQVLVERLGQDAVEVRRVRHGEDRVQARPAGAHREQHGPEREEREEVPLVDARRQDEEGDRDHGEGDEQRAAVVTAPDRRGEERDQTEEQPAPDGDGGDAEHEETGTAVRAGRRQVADPGAALGEAVAVLRDEGPRVERVDGQPRVAGRRVEDLPEQPHDGQSERQAQELGRGKPDERRRHEAARPVAGRPRDQVAAQDQDRCERDQDPELGLDDRGHRREERRPFVPSTPQLAHGEQQDQRPDRVDLGPDRAVEPGDRHEQDHRGGDQRRAAAGAQVGREQEDGDREPEVGEDRGQLQQGARRSAGPAEQLRDQAQAPQDIEVAGRVVDEDRAVVDPERPVPGELHRPAVERVDVHLEPRPGQEDVCDDEPKGEAEREKDAERDGDVPKPHPGPLAGPRPLARCGASQGKRPP